MKFRWIIVCLLLIALPSVLICSLEQKYCQI